MKQFADLYDALDRTTSTNAKVAALAAYFAEAPPADAAWALFFLTGRRLKRLVPAASLREWTLELTGLPDWLLSESYAAVGDLAETIALVLDGQAPLTAEREDCRGPAALFAAEEEPDLALANLTLAQWIEQRILPMRGLDAEEQRRQVRRWWLGLDARELFLLNKLLTGEFRVGVSQTLVVRAIAQIAGLPTTIISQRLMGQWTPSASFFARLLAPQDAEQDRSQPYPFFLASPFDGDISTLGDPRDWLIEWKWDGIRAQLIQRGGRVSLWSRGEELVTERFPELAHAATLLADGTVLDGEILAFHENRPLPFARLQHRIGRQRGVAAMMGEVPVVFMAYDVLEREGVDWRAHSMRDRRDALAAIIAARSRILELSPALEPTSWTELENLRSEARARHVEGVMLKRWTSTYGTGRQRGDWWKWKVEPLTIDAVLVYAQPGSGRRASLFTDYTFALWKGADLVPVAKAYAGLSDQEIDELDRWVRRHTTERFGPVSAVEPVQVFEIAFEAAMRSTRHKSGVAVRFPRILRWRRDKSAREADRIEALERFLTAS